MNILTPTVLEAAAEALYESRMALIVTQGRWASVPSIIQDEWKRDAAAAFNAAIDRLIKEGRAHKLQTIEDRRPFSIPAIIIEMGEP